MNLYIYEHSFSLISKIFFFRTLIFLVSGRIFWRLPKPWLRTQRCLCPELLRVRTSWPRPPSLQPKPSPSSLTLSNLEQPALALMTLRHRSPPVMKFCILSCIWFFQDFTVTTQCTCLPFFFLQVVLINAVKDVAKALAELISATKCAAGKAADDPSMYQLKSAAKVRGSFWNATTVLKKNKKFDRSISNYTMMCS